MAKQTFTTGQVLTAAQMTSLQETAMGGGSATAKTASYTLVAADAGTVVRMNAATATTITVNTSLFAAGDTLYIQNIGAGVCTITAGTATVNTASSLALAQYEGGTLYFTAASASLFFKADGAAPAAGGANYTLISTQTASGVAVTFSSLSGFNSYILVLNVVKTNGSAQDGINVILNNDTAANYTNTGLYFAGGTQDSFASTTATAINGASFGSSSGNEVNGFFYISGANTANHKVGWQSTAGSGTNRTARSGAIIWRNSSTVTSIKAEIATDSYLSGSFLLYGSVV